MKHEHPEEPRDYVPGQTQRIHPLFSAAIQTDDNTLTAELIDGVWTVTPPSE